MISSTLLLQISSLMIKEMVGLSFMHSEGSSRLIIHGHPPLNHWMVKDWVSGYTELHTIGA